MSEWVDYTDNRPHPEVAALRRRIENVEGALADAQAEIADLRGALAEARLEFAAQSQRSRAYMEPGCITAVRFEPRETSDAEIRASYQSEDSDR